MYILIGIRSILDLLNLRMLPDSADIYTGSTTAPTGRFAAGDNPEMFVL